MLLIPIDINVRYGDKYDNEYDDLDSTAVSIFVVILVELTNIVFVNSTNIPTNIKTAVLSRGIL